jgi:hypothetical protein
VGFRAHAPTDGTASVRGSALGPANHRYLASGGSEPSERKERYWIATESTFQPTLTLTLNDLWIFQEPIQPLPQASKPFPDVNGGGGDSLPRLWFFKRGPWSPAAELGSWLGTQIQAHTRPACEKSYCNKLFRGS